MGSQLTVAQAAERLRISPGRVRKLISSGALEAERFGPVWIVSAESVEHRRSDPVPRGQPLSASNAWALLLSADGRPVPWLDPNARHRVRRHLTDSGLAAMRPRLRRRAVRIIHADAHRGEVTRLARRRDLMPTGIPGSEEYRLGLHGGDPVVDGYVPESLLPLLVEEHALATLSRGRGNVRLRAVPDDLWSHVGGAVAPRTVVVVDLAESDDPRARRVGQAAMADWTPA
jgi:excisionase family DNA binding protein